ncbi:hypothetical protein [Sorangium sp. So ce1389]|uniref:hypothetical protein n=1 Tax=Sorangium sp. So ce1389 TaxID=3133336 RepID=UPI003F5EB7E6
MTDFVAHAQRENCLKKHQIVMIGDPIETGKFTIESAGADQRLRHMSAERKRLKYEDLYPTAVAPNFGLTKNYCVKCEQTGEVYFSITKSDHVAYTDCYELRVHADEDNARRAAYVLPWREDEITYMDLGDAYDFFFTGPLSGCQVYVGTRGGQVRVYHANSNYMGANLRAPSQSSAYMDKLYDLAKQNGETLTHRLDKDQYVAYVKENEVEEDGTYKTRLVGDGSSGKEEFVTKEVSTDVLTDYIARKTGQSRREISVIQTYAFVFGVRRLGAWSFFFHVIGMASYKRPGLLSNRENKWKTIIPCAPLPTA